MEWLLQVAAALLANDTTSKKFRKVILVDKDKLQMEGAKERLRICLNGGERPEDECQKIPDNQMENYKVQGCSICSSIASCLKAKVVCSVPRQSRAV